VSYGTELAQFLMRERPRGLRAVVLDAVVPLGFSLVTDAQVNKQKVMARYASSCARSKACNAAYPNLGTRYAALLDRLDKTPVRLDASAQPASAPSPVAKAAAASAADADAPQWLTGRDLDAALYQSIYMREAVPLVPYVVYRAEQGDFSFVLNFVQMLQASGDDLADAMYITVVCAEFGDTPGSALRFHGLTKRLAEEGMIDAKRLLATCRDWKIRLLDKALLQPVHSDIPTLLLSGRFDPITPPEQADRVAATLSRAYRFTFAGGTHGQAFMVPCANHLIAQFLDAPTRRPDGRCVQEATPTFYTPDQLLRLPSRVPGSASIEDHVQALAGPGLAVGLALLLLFSAVPVYSVFEIVRVFRGRRVELPAGWRGRLIGAAPWVPVLGGFLLLAFLVAAASSIGGAIERNQFLLLVGVVPAWVKSLTWALLPFVATMALMTAALRLLWRHRARSVAGRIYYTLLVLAGWSVCLALFKTGLFGL
ncbi:MAG TPA: alpha/beta hydrolase, partial [Burkholderiaceae bacterium]|nr:alpha/beta hydrolase [Burkholderiaceae bacterium]